MRGRSTRSSRLDRAGGAGVAACAGGPARAAGHRRGGAHDVPGVRVRAAGAEGPGRVPGVRASVPGVGVGARVGPGVQAVLDLREDGAGAADLIGRGVHAVDAEALTLVDGAPGPDGILV